MEYDIEVYDEEGIVIKEDRVTLMGLRVFCEHEMYTKLNTREYSTVLISAGEEEE